MRYKFDTGVDDTRKEAFRAAAADWRLHTCIAVVEDPNAEARWETRHLISGNKSEADLYIMLFTGGRSNIEDWAEQGNQRGTEPSCQSREPRSSLQNPCRMQILPLNRQF